jgi:hypothetical protein
MVILGSNSSLIVDSFSSVTLGNFVTIIDDYKTQVEIINVKVFMVLLVREKKYVLNFNVGCLFLTNSNFSFC